MRTTAGHTTIVGDGARVESPPPRTRPATRRTAAQSYRVRTSGVGLLVIGDEELRSSVERMARNARRRVVKHLDLDAPPEGLAPDSEAAWDELVVSEELLDQTRAIHPEWVAKASRVWLIPPGGASLRTPFAPLPRLGGAVKRILDVVGAVVGLLLFLPILVVAAVAVRIESRGPALFSQVRVGAHGRRFRLYKLRTMVANNDDAEHRAYYAALVRGDASPQDGMFKLRDDPRVTRVGRMLRRLSIDELPQLWNVLRGDMSLVGPRPMQPHELELCDGSAWLRLRVRPGITGLWQVSGRCNLTFGEMVALDTEYWRSWTLRRDLMILLRTPKAALTGKGAA